MSKIPSPPKSIQTFSSIPYFAGLDEKVIVEIAKMTIEQHFAMGETVFQEGEPCKGLYIVQDGWLKGVIMSPAGREQTIRLLGPGEVFNEIGVLLPDGTNLVTVQALEPSTLWLIERAALLRMLDEHPSLCRIVTQNLAQRVVHLMKLVGDLSLHSVEARLVHMLLEQSQEGTVYRHKWATQAEMAAQLGTVIDVINRALHSLEAGGLIRFSRHRIEILDARGLEERFRSGN
jgi:CRP-like cAMP-binding protein